MVNGDSEEELFSYGEQLLDETRVYGDVFWDDGLGGHDLDMDGNPMKEAPGGGYQVQIPLDGQDFEMGLLARYL